ncbi:LytR/AlgR family response regulator transcription factor [Larkinella rosea]|uniref:LytTR family transcriptional regulator n=1 Tax=Larkinella rosea TaxID=2025312 RepID=A0A3P1BV42_9BACT|nr:LytTR family DNA-binding domain-containing protein [Larkinella rosea]RRB04434.1 LytTR family transcriptional regulator [Larkinella rosea]
MKPVILPNLGRKTVSEPIKIPLTLETIQRFGLMALLLTAIYSFLTISLYITHFEFKKELAAKLNGWYVLICLEVTMIIPEMVTLYGLQKLLLIYHRLIPIRSVRLTALGVGRYYLSLLPLLLTVFFIISPFTQTVRFFLEVPIESGFDALTFTHYFHNFLIGPYVRPVIVATYSLVIPFLGYCMISVSLIRDFFVWRDQQKKSQVEERQIEKVANYATSLTVQSNQGQTVIHCSEVALITSDSPNCLVHHLQGTYKLCHKTLTEVEAMLDPELFFRVNRGGLVNRTFVDGYVHVGNNNYIVNLKPPFQHQTVSLSRTRLSEFRHWLEVSVQIQFHSPSRF